MYDVIKQLNYQSYLLHFDNLAVANLHCRVDCNLPCHAKFSEKSEWIMAAISQYVTVVERNNVNFVKQSRIDLILQLIKFMSLSCSSACAAK